MVEAVEDRFWNEQNLSRGTVLTKWRELKGDEGIRGIVGTQGIVGSPDIWDVQDFPVVEDFDWK